VNRNRVGADQSQHGVLPAGVRRQDSAHQAPPWKERFMAAAGDPRGDGRLTPIGRRAPDRGGGPHPRAGRSPRARGRRGNVLGARRGAQGLRHAGQNVLDRLEELGVLTPELPRLRRADGRGDHRGHLAVPSPAATRRASASPSTTTLRYREGVDSRLSTRRWGCLIGRLAGQGGGRPWPSRSSRRGAAPLRRA